MNWLKKNKYFLFIVTLILFAVFSAFKVSYSHLGADISASLNGDGYELMKIDGCQYIKYNGNLLHKGDCPNPIHYKLTLTLEKNQ